jgi:hypothetical protein
MDRWPRAAVETVREVNDLDLDTIAEKLLALRAS